MTVKNIKILIISLLFSIFTVIGLFYINLFVYDQNNPFNINLRADKDSKVKSSMSYLLSFDKEISSEDFRKMIYIIGDSGLKNFVIDGDYSFIEDKSGLEDINQFIGSRNNFYNAAGVSGSKVLGIFNDKSDNLRRHDSIGEFVETKNDFIMANQITRYAYEPVFKFSNDAVGIYNKKSSDTDMGNIDIIYKFGDKYLYSVPFLLYLSDMGIKPDMVKFDLFYGKIGKIKKIYVDERGKSSILYKKIGAGLDVHNYTEWSDMLKIRAEIIDGLKKLDLYKIGDGSGFDVFKSEETLIDNVYGIDKIDDPDKNAQLDQIKNRTTLWRSFKQANKDLMSGRTVFVCGKGLSIANVEKIVADRELLKRDSLIRMPIILIYLIVLILTGVFFALSYSARSFVAPVLSAVGVALLAFIVHNLARNFILLDFPLMSFIAGIFYGVLSGILFRLLNYKFLLDEVNDNFRYGVSYKFIKETAKLLTDKKWDFSQRKAPATFLMVDVNDLYGKEMDDEEILYINKRINFITENIKNNHGIINHMSSSHIFSFFGNPQLHQGHAYDAVKSAVGIMAVPDGSFDKTIVTTAAIHSKEEYFDLAVRGRDRVYTNYGSSSKILGCMIKTAKYFNVKIILSAPVYKLCNKGIKVRMLDRIKIGNTGLTERLFEYMTGEEFAAKEKLLDYYHAGLKLFESKNWEDASYYFKQCLKIDKDDIPSEVYLQRCKDFIYIPPKDDWDGLFEVE